MSEDENTLSQHDIPNTLISRMTQTFALVKEPQIALFVVSIVFAVLNIPFVVVRFVARRRAWGGHFGLSDAALLAALVGCEQMIWTRFVMMRPVY